jgi:peroxiredoxin
MTTIAEQVNEVKAAATSRLSAEVVAVFASDQAALAAGGVPTGAVAVGDRLATFALPDATGQARTLDELTADGPAVLVFYRGGWCPYCNLTLRTYERDLLPHLSAYSARLVAISPETPDASLSTQEKDELTYTVLSDTGTQLADTLGITFDPSEVGLAAQRTLGVDIRTTREDGGTRLPMPTVLIVDPAHTVRFVDIHPDYTGRTEVTDIIAALETANANMPGRRS